MDTQPARQCDGCGKDLAADEPVYISTNPHAPSCVLCSDCDKAADTDTAPPICEVDVTVNDNDEGGPYHFVPCEQPATRIIHWINGQGTEVFVRLCDFHATGEL